MKDIGTKIMEPRAGQIIFFLNQPKNQLAKTNHRL